MKHLFPTLALLFLLQSAPAQDFVYRTFKDSRIINTHSVETLPKRKLDVRITHRFGDIAGDNGGYATFFGLENAVDVLIGAEYGLSDNLTIGVARTKGAGALPDGAPGLRQNLNGLFKLRLLRQREGGQPFTLTFVGVGTMSTAEKIDNPGAIRDFASFSHRFAYTGQLLIASKYSETFSLQANAAWTHRNAVPFGDVNDIVSLGLAARLQLTKVFGLIVDYNQPLNGERTTSNGFYPILGLGLEIDTGGHVFQLNLTNATGIMETDFLPYTTSNWADGEFRFGFTISRLFNL